MIYRCCLICGNLFEASELDHLGFDKDGHPGQAVALREIEVTCDERWKPECRLRAEALAREKIDAGWQGFRCRYDERTVTAEPAA